MDIESLWQELENELLPTLRGFRSRLGSLRVEEKADRTLLSEADLAVQEQIIRCIRTVDPDGLIVAEAVAISREYLIENFSGAWCHLCRLKLDF